ncbi:MAG TPA: hypothetical protein VN428_09610, partial [Bryobacteraceae bacterium]|nr:hypothetical protein [Bryobacteraceae bacterium]
VIFSGFWFHLFHGGIVLTITDLLVRVIEETRRRIRNGEATERGLARRAGLSQPHVHNVVKGVRVLSPASADRLMQALGFRLVDVMAADGQERRCPVCGCPAQRSPVGPQDLTAAAFALSRELRARTRRSSPVSAAQDGIVARPTSR